VETAVGVEARARGLSIRPPRHIVTSGMPRDEATIVSPIAEDATERLTPAPRVASLEGARVALIDNSKHNADRFLDTLATLLVRDHGVAKIERYRKVSASVPTPPEVLSRLLEASDAAVHGVAD